MSNEILQWIVIAALVINVLVQGRRQQEGFRLQKKLVETIKDILTNRVG